MVCLRGESLTAHESNDIFEKLLSAGSLQHSVNHSLLLMLLKHSNSLRHRTGDSGPTQQGVPMEQIKEIMRQNKQGVVAVKRREWNHD